jgi:translocation and assembly module TamB
VFSLLCLGATFIVYIGTESGLKQFTYLLEKVSGGRFHIAGVQGRLWRDVDMRGIRIETNDMKVVIDSIQLRWHATRLWAGELRVDQLAVGAVRIDNKLTPPKPNTATKAPSSLTLPLQINMTDVTLARLAIDSDEARVSDVALTLHSDGTQYQLGIKRVATAVGILQGEAFLSGVAPFVAKAQLNLSGAIKEKPLTAALKMQGDLRQLYVIGEAKSPIFDADIDILLDVFAPYPYGFIRNGKIEINNVDPHLFNADAPNAQIFVKADIVPVAENQVKGQISIKNTQPHPVDLQGIPVSALDINWHLVNQQLKIQAINIDVSKGGKLSGQGLLQPETFTLDLTAQAVDLQNILSTQAKSAVNGTLRLAGPYNAPNMEMKLHDARYQFNLAMETGWRSSAKEHTLLIKQFLLTQEQGKIHAVGELGLAGTRPFKLDAKVEAFNPAKLGRYPSGNINATVKAEGMLPPHLEAKVAYFLQPSYFNEAPLSGKGDIIWRNDRLEHADAVLDLGSNHVTVKGEYGSATGHLAVHFDLANLSQIAKGLTGKVRGQAMLQGKHENLALQTQLQAAGLKLGNVAIRTLSLEGNIEPDLQRPFHVNIKGEAMEVDKLSLAHLNARVSGTRAHHTLNLDSQGQWEAYPLFLSTELIGSLPNITEWQGTIPRLKMGFAEGVLVLKSTANLHIHPGTMQLEHAVLASTHSHVNIQKLALEKGKLDTQGQLTRLDIADILAWMPHEATRSNLVLNGRWQLTAEETINGKVELKRQQGDVIWHANSPSASPTALKLSDLNIYAHINDGRAEINGHILTEGGQIKGNAVTRLSKQEGKWGIYNTSPLSLQVKGSIPNLEAISGFISPSLKLGGRLNIDVTRTGTVGQANLSGIIRGDALVVQDTTLGLHLTEGTINAHLTPDTFVLEKFNFKGGSGVLNAQGRVGLNNRHAKITIHANRLTALSRPDMFIMLSGQSTMFVKNGELTVEGQAHIDEAKIYLANGDTPRLSEDVVIQGRPAPQQVKTENFTLAALQLEVDLGKKTFFSGKGVEALLGGKLHMAAQARQPIYATGVIRVDKGSYRAYGQNLTIKQGFISFQGPLDNPALDIVAVRQGPAVEAGVKVSGTAIRPRVMLVSEPSVPDNEKISWMMFGKGTDTLNPQDGASVLAAASSLWMTGDGPSLQKRVADTVGLDEVEISSGTTVSTAQTTYLTLGKRLADNIYLSYEQSLGEVDSALKLQYIFSKHWQAIARAGIKETTFDVFYTISFD